MSLTDDEITCMNAGFENQTTLDALIGTGVTDGSAYATGNPSFRILVFFDCTFIDNSKSCPSFVFQKNWGKEQLVEKGLFNFSAPIRLF